MNIQVEPPEKSKSKRKKKTKNSSPSSLPPSSSSPSVSSLPDEIVVNCLARISRSSYPTLSIVSKSFRSLLSSAELYAARSHFGNTEQCLYVCLYDSSFHIHQWFRLWINPNRTRPDSMIKKKKKTIGQFLVPVTCNFSSNLPSESESTIVVGSEIYVIGGPVDCWSHTWRDAPSMNIARMNALACLHDGKIYVIGGCPGVESWDEVFDIKAQTWERLPDPGTELRNRFIPYRLADIEGKIHTGNGINKYAYYTKQRKCDGFDIKRATFPKSELVLENVSYRYVDFNGRCGCFWYDIKYGGWKEVKGLDSLGEKYDWNGSTTKLVSCGGKLLVIWQGCRIMSEALALSSRLGLIDLYDISYIQVGERRRKQSQKESYKSKGD